MNDDYLMINFFGEENESEKILLFYLKIVGRVHYTQYRVISYLENLLKVLLVNKIKKNTLYLVSKIFWPLGNYKD